MKADTRELPAFSVAADSNVLTEMLNCSHASAQLFCLID